MFCVRFDDRFVSREPAIMWATMLPTPNQMILDETVVRAVMDLVDVGVSSAPQLFRVMQPNAMIEIYRIIEQVSFAAVPVVPMEWV